MNIVPRVWALHQHLLLVVINIYWHWYSTMKQSTGKCKELYSFFNWLFINGTLPHLYHYLNKILCACNSTCQQHNMSSIYFMMLTVLRYFYITFTSKHCDCSGSKNFIFMRANFPDQWDTLKICIFLLTTIVCQVVGPKVWTKIYEE